MNRLIKPNLAFHEIMGEQLCVIRNSMFFLGELIAERYPKQDAVCTAQRNAVAALDRLRCHLDRAVCSELVNDFSSSIYFCGNRPVRFRDRNNLPPDMRGNLLEWWTETNAKNRLGINPDALRKWVAGDRVHRVQTIAGGWVYCPDDIRDAHEAERGQDETD